MKKYLKSLLLITAVVALVASLAVFASAASSGTCGDNVSWTLDDSKTLTISGTGAMKDYYSYSTSPWYSSRSSIKTVIIEEGVTTIGNHAFYNCTSLTSVTIGDSVTRIGYWAFDGCTSLTSVTIPDSVTSIGYFAFSGCTSLMSVTIPDSVTSFGERTFYGCSDDLVIYGRAGSSASKYAESYGITFVADKDKTALISYGTCGDSVTYTLDTEGMLTISGTGEMDDFYMYGHGPWYSVRSSIKKVIIEDGVTSIGGEAFAYCDSLTSVTIPDSVTIIYSYAFDGCTSLTGVTIPDSVTTIGAHAFSGCTSLTSVTIGDSVTTIGGYAFSGCTSLTSVTIPDSVTTIEYGAFDGCTSLTSVTIPDSVTTIEYGAFDGCTSLEEVYITDLAAWCKIDFYDSTSNPLSNGAALYINGTLATDIEISDSVTTIGNYVFYGYKSLTSITIPDSVTSIGNSAFYNCTSLTSVTIPDSVTSIGNSAFSGCTSLTSVTIPDSVTSIGYDAFYNCTSLEGVNITDVGAWSQIEFGDCYANPLYYADHLYINGKLAVDIEIPEGITEIKDYAFYYDILNSVKLPSSIKKIGSSAFAKSYDSSAAVDAYIPDIATWCNIEFENASSSPLNRGGNLYVNGVLTKNITIPQGIKSIGKYTFYGSSIEKVTIPEGVTSIGDYAFYGSEVEQVTIPSSIESIGPNAFYSSDIKSISFPKYFPDLEKLRFSYCRDLESVALPEGMTKLEEDMFYSCDNLRSVTIPSSVTVIEGGAFEYCGRLMEITLPNGLKTIKARTFYQSGLSEITIPDGVQSIQDYAFAYSENLMSVTIPESVVSISKTAFDGCGKVIIYGKVGSAAEKYAREKGISFNKEIKRVKGITLDKKTLSMNVYDWVQLTATVSPSNADVKDIIWTSSDTNVVSVYDGGVYAQGGGKATITATTVDGGYTATCTVTVTVKPVPATAVKFASTKATAYVGNSLDLGKTVTVTPFNTTDEIVWTSSNTKVATVDSRGIVTAHTTGTAKITAKAGSKSASCTVTVARPADGIVVTGSNALAKGKSVTLKAYAYYMENGKEKKTKDTISWRSEDESIATVSKGSVKGIGAGTTNIIAYIEGSDIEEVIEVTVAVPITSIKFASTKATLYAGNEFDLGAGLTFAPVENNDNIVWKSSNTNVATVDEYGVVTPIATGTAKITATAEAGKKTATCTVTVAKAPEGIVVTGATTVAKGKTSKLTAYAYYMENGKEKKTKDVISWRSENTSIATVSKGSVKGIGAGTTNIIAYIEGSDIEEVIEVTVAVPITSIKFASTKATLYAGNEFDLGAGLTFAPVENNDNITWKSSNTKVATVDEYGVVTPLATGTAKITATAEAGKKTASCSITVSKAPEGIVVTGSNALAKGKSVTLKAYACYMENGKEKKTKDTISWRSEDPSIVTVSKGKIKGISAGTTNIIAYIEGTDIEEVIEVSVVIPAKTVKLSIKKLTASIGDEIDLNEYLTVTPDDNSDNITWTTSKATVATVEDGIVKIVGKGSAKISAKAVAGGKSASVTITVK